jgi:hypothetical protein
MQARYLLLLLAFLLAPVPASAAASISCGAWLQDRRAGGWEAVADAAFISGFVMGVGWAVPGNITAGTDPSGWAAWIENYGRAHPLDYQVDAAIALVKALQAKRPKDAD